MLVVLAGFRAAEIYRDFSLPHEITYGEGITARFARDYRDGLPIYHDYRQVPYVFAPYGPLTYVVPGWIARFSDADEIGIYRIGRTLSLLASIGSLVLIGALLRRAAVGWPVVAVMVLLFFTAEINWPVLFVFRPDSLETGWILLGLLAFSSTRSEAGRILALGPLVVAGLFKHSALVAPAVLTVCVFAREGMQAVLRFGIATVLVFGGTFAALEAMTHGLFSLNTIEDLRGNVTWANPLTIGQSVLRGDPVLTALAAVALAGRCLTRRMGPPALYLLIGVPFAALGTLRDGSATNYFLGSMAVACVLGGEELAHWTGFQCAARRAGGSSGKAHARTLIVGILMLAAGVVVYAPRLRTAIADAPRLWRNLRLRETRDQVLLNDLTRMAGDLDARGGPILALDNDLNLRSANAVMMDPLTFGGLADQGRFDDRHLIELIRECKLGTIVLPFPLTAPEVPRYQSTAWVREEWLRAMRETGYVLREVRHGQLRFSWYVYRCTVELGPAARLLLER